MLKMDRLCSHMIRLLHAPIHVYGPDGTLLTVYVDLGEQQDVFNCDPDLVTQLLERAAAAYPVLYLDSDETIYSIVTAGQGIFIMGPCCLGQDPAAASRQFVRRHKMDVKKPFRISACSLIDFCEWTLLLYEHLTDSTMDYSELLERNFCDDRFETAMNSKIHEVIYSMRESDAIHNPYAQEMREQESIRAGDLQSLQRSFEEAYVGKLGTLARDPLRNMKNMGIVLITLASRSAIVGGLLPEIAYSMSDAFIQRLEELHNPGEALALARQAEVEYCNSVNRLTLNRTRNTLISRCKTLVIQQLHSKVSVQELARQLEVSPNHLSHLFMKEESMKLTDYIIREKISSAKAQLAYTDDSYGAIAFSFGFSSQSHFGQAFKKWTGMTPKEYRTQYHKYE